MFEAFFFFQTKRNKSFCGLSVPQLPAGLDLEVEAQGNGQGILEVPSHFFSLLSCSFSRKTQIKANKEKRF